MVSLTLLFFLFLSGDKSETLRFLYGKWTDYFKSADVTDYKSYMAEHERFQVPDKPEKNSGSRVITDHPMMNYNRTHSLDGTAGMMMDNKCISGKNGDHLMAENGSKDDLEVKKSDSAYSLHIPNSRLLWIAKQRPEYSSDYYNFGEFTMLLNELTDDLKKVLPPTDCRLRPDIRLLEEGDLGRSKFFGIFILLAY